MDRYEEVGFLLAGDTCALTQPDVIVAVADHYGTKTFSIVNQPLHAPTDFQHDIFLTGTARADGSRVFAPMAGIDGDNDIALRVGGRRLACRHLGINRYRRFAARFQMP